MLEAIDARRGIRDHLEEELGDLLFQVVFHATIAAEEGWFTLADVARGIHDKLVSRHPHVFGDVEVADAAEVASNWERIKAEEKGRASVLDGVPDRAARADAGRQGAAEGGSSAGDRAGAGGSGCSTTDCSSSRPRPTPSARRSGGAARWRRRPVTALRAADAARDPSAGRARARTSCRSQSPLARLAVPVITFRRH